MGIFSVVLNDQVIEDRLAGFARQPGLLNNLVIEDNRKEGPKQKCLFGAVLVLCGAFIRDCALVSLFVSSFGRVYSCQVSILVRVSACLSVRIRV